VVKSIDEDIEYGMRLHLDGMCAASSMEATLSTLNRDYRAEELFCSN
jgi:hypothetical protein